MVNFLRSNKSNIKVCPLKSRKLDYFRINPGAIVRRGVQRLVRHGFIASAKDKPEDNPNKFIANGFAVHWMPTRFNDNHIHIGITVSVKTVSKLATQRNLVRRRLRSIINQYIRSYRISGFDFVFTARSTISEIPFEKLEAEFKRAMQYVERKVRISRIANKMNSIYQ